MTIILIAGSPCKSYGLGSQTKILKIEEKMNTNKICKPPTNKLSTKDAAKREEITNRLEALKSVERKQDIDNMDKAFEVVSRLYRQNEWDKKF